VLEEANDDICCCVQGKEFDNTDGLLGGTMKRLGTMMEQGGSKHMLYLIGFVVLVFVLLYLTMRS
jgi:blocked-early-in-transport protein 1